MSENTTKNAKTTKNAEIYAPEPTCKKIFGDGFSIPDFDYETHPVKRSTAADFAARMHLGWNLGNSLDACLVSDEMKAKFSGLDTELCWSNPRTTRAMLHDIRTAGFDTIRIPVSWHDHFLTENTSTIISGTVSRDSSDIPQNAAGPDSHYTIDPAWMDRVAEVVDWALGEGFYVFLNTHHDISKEAICPTPEKREQSLLFIRRVWEQIAARFKSYDEKLVFEAMNEPRVPGSKYEWDTNLSVEECTTAISIINELNQAFVDVVRSSGGNNTDRFLVVACYANAVENALSDVFKMPSDPTAEHLILAVHCYRPVRFAFLLKDHESSVDFDPYDENDTEKVSTLAKQVYEKFITSGIPVVIDEFGAVYKENQQARINYLAYHTAICRSYGITCHLWDNGNLLSAGDGMAIYDRANGYFPDKTIVEALVRYAK